MVAGVGLCDPAAVDVLVDEGPARVRELIRLGAEFDRHPDGSLMLTREGGHHANRIVHAGGDATGAEVQRALHAAVRRDPWIRLVEHALVLDLLRDADGRACGVTLHVLGEGSRGRRRRGAGPGGGARHRRHGPGLRGHHQPGRCPPATVWRWRCGPARPSPTSSSSSSTRPRSYLGGRAARVGAAAAGQRGAARRGRLPGRRATASGSWSGQHELAELAPRDVVAKGIHRVMLADRRRPRLPRRPAPRRRVPGRPLPDHHRRPAGRPASTRPPT